ncbi:Transposon Ty3-G Gag-Pol polyprotein [Trichinella patagoniensis]|uniref:RNA-directed DNA polymerase n=1 Tax=Trichinella patagoniensis TaxID=990121 RepID=A0A0V0ZU90_9BILA|nr:Transposon Ty3-G Gag-Pol polyprotein [Trichinella patagoniensis]
MEGRRLPKADQRRPRMDAILQGEDDFGQMNLRTVVTELVKEMVKAGVIEPASGPRSYSVVLVKKKDGPLQFCVDYCKLNALTMIHWMGHCYLPWANGNDACRNNWQLLPCIPGRHCSGREGYGRALVAAGRVLIWVLRHKERSATLGLWRSLLQAVCVRLRFQSGSPTWTEALKRWCAVTDHLNYAEEELTKRSSSWQLHGEKHLGPLQPTVNRRIMCRVYEMLNIGERTISNRQAYPGDLERHLQLPDGRSPDVPVKTLAKTCQNCAPRAVPVKAHWVPMQLHSGHGVPVAACWWCWQARTQEERNEENFPHLAKGNGHPLVPGKRTARDLMAVGSSGKRVRCLFFVQERSYGMRFLVDTGSEVSVVPYNTTLRSQLHATDIPQLTSANGTRIDVVGSRELTVDLASAPGRHDVMDLLERTRQDQQYKICQTSKPTIHSIQHHILTHGPPVFARPRRLPPDRLELAQKEFDILLDLGIIRPSSSSWASPLHMVPKKQPNTWRPCRYYGRLNNVTKPDRYLIPNINDFVTHLGGRTIFYKVDLIRAYQQIPVAEEDIPKTAIMTPFGLFEDVRMPFGLRNAAQTFQRFMDEVTRGLRFCFVYLDDVLVASRSKEEHEKHLANLFRRFEKYGVKLNPAKCVFFAPDLEFLGFKVCSQGIKPLAEKVEAIRRFRQPTTMHELRQFLRCVNFYRRFIPRAATLLAPLERLTSSHDLHKKLKLPEDAVKAFDEVKEALANATLLSHLQEGAALSLVVDASDHATGAAL